MQEVHVDTAGFGTLAGLRSGAAGTPKVLALHGWLDNAASFLPLLPHLPPLDLVALDMPGHGASAHLPAAAEYTVATTARAVFAAADALGWERFALLGHSLGGVVASMMAAAMPARIERLLTIESLGPLSEEEGRTGERLREAFTRGGAVATRPLRVYRDPAQAVRARLQAGGIGEDAARILVQRGLGPVRGGNDAPGFSWRSDPRLTRPTAVRLTEGQVRDLLRSIQCPVRVVYAEQDQPYHPEALRQARVQCLRHGEVVRLPGGHHLHMESPGAVAAAIGGFFDGVPEAAR